MYKRQLFSWEEVHKVFAKYRNSLQLILDWLIRPASRQNGTFQEPGYRLKNTPLLKCTFYSYRYFMWAKRSLKVLSEEEFAEIYRAYWQRLYSTGYNYVRDKATAQELVQEVFVKLWLKRDEITQIENAEAYLFTCLRNKVYDHFDRVACHKKLSKHTLENYSEERYAVDETIAFNEAMSVISDELDKMPEKTRTIFRMSKFDSHTNDEIASKMHLSGKAVEYHITQALKKLRIRLAVFLS